jgi:methionine-rich copper-binding protein CopC
MVDDAHTLVGAYVVDALDDIERARFERRLATCPACDSDVADLRGSRSNRRAVPAADDRPDSAPLLVRTAVPLDCGGATRWGRGLARLWGVSRRTARHGAVSDGAASPAVLVAVVVAVLVAVLVALAGPGAGPAAAHTSVTSTEPADGAMLAAAPDQVVVSFTEAPVAGSTRLAVTGPAGPVPVSPSLSGRTLAATLPAGLGPGRFTVTYRVAAGDGHVLSGSWAFVVVPTDRPASASPTRTSASSPSSGTSTPGPSTPGVATPGPSAEPSLTPASTTTGGSSPTGLLWAAVVLVLGAGALTWALRRRLRQAGRW